MTINISLPKTMYEDAKAYLTRRGYSSVSELVRDALRDELYPTLTENGFTPEFEEAILQSEAEPRRKDKVWRTAEDIDRYFSALKKKIRESKLHAKN